LVAAAGRVNLERSRRRRFLSTGSKERPVIRRLHPASSPGHHPPTPPQLVWVTARQRRRSGASRTGIPGPKNRVKDEAPPLARRRVGSGLSGFGALSVLACGGGVSFRFWHLRCPSAVRVLFGVVSFAGRGRCAFGVARSVSLLCAERAGAPSRRTVAEAGSFHPAGDHRGAGVGAEPQRWASGAAANTRRVTAIIAERCRRGAVECFSRNAVIVTHRGGTLARRGSPRATGQFNRGSVAPGKAHWVDPHGMMFSPAQRARPNQGPTLPGATGWFHSSGAGDSNTRGRVNTFPAGDCHRRSELHCCRRPSPEGHFRGAAHIIAEQAPAPTVHTPQGHNTAAAHTTRRTIRAPRTHHQ